MMRGCDRLRLPRSYAGIDKSSEVNYDSSGITISSYSTLL